VTVLVFLGFLARLTAIRLKEILIMTDDETERKMSFIIEQQAQFNSDILQLRESQAQTDQVVARLAYATLEGFKDVNVKIDALVDSQIQLSEARKLTDERLDAKIAALVESQIEHSEMRKRSDQQLDAKIAALFSSDQQLDAKMKELADSQIQLSEAQKRTEQGIALTDRNLRRLIAKVDQQLSDKSNESENC
jgi:hypothetical protein